MAAVSGGALPASAATTDQYPDLDATFANPAARSGVIELSADLTQDLTSGDHGNRLDLAPGQTLMLDLNGHDLTTAAITLGAGSTLTITDTSPGDPGVLTASAVAGGYTNPDPLDNRAGIETTGATLVIEGRATVVAAGGSEGTAGIGGADGGDGGTIIIRGDADVTAYGAHSAAAIGSGNAGAASVPLLKSGPITIGGNAKVTAIGDRGAAIGGGDYSDSGDITITDNAVVTASSVNGAGIGGGFYGGSNAGTIRIDKDATVDATAAWGAAIGGGHTATPGQGGNGGTIEITDSAHVTATNTTYGAAIGGGGQGNGGTVTISGDATVTATSTGAGAGIGGGFYGSGGELTVSGNPTVVATGKNGAPGIGGGADGQGGDVRLLGGTVTAINADDPTLTSSAVGNGRRVSGFGSLQIADPATLIIPDPAVLRVPADVTVTGDGQLRGGATPGTVINDGAVQLATEDVDWSTLGLYPNNYLVTRLANSGTPDQEVRVFATTLAAGARQVPAEPTKAGHTLTGWNLAQDGSGDAVDLALDTPISADVTHFAQWALTPVDPPAPPAPEDPVTPAPVVDGPSTVTAPARAGALATTGTDLALWSAIAGGLVLAGGATVLIVRRRARQH